MNSGGPPANGGLGGQDGATNGTHGISTEAAVAALEQHDTLFHRQVMHLRQQQVKLGMSVTMFVFFLSHNSPQQTQSTRLNKGKRRKTWATR